MKRPSGFEGPAEPLAPKPRAGAGRRRPGAAAKPAEQPRQRSYAAREDPAQKDPGRKEPIRKRPGQQKRAQREPVSRRSERERGSRAVAASARAQQRAARGAERDELRRFTRGLRRRRRILAAVLLSGAFLVTLLLIGMFSPLFAVRVIEVRGTGQLDAAQVQEALDGQLGIPLPLVSPGQIAESLAQFPQIESYVTESRLPDTLLVRIVERTPIAVIRDGADFSIVDAAGVTLQSGPERFEDLPLIQVGQDGVDGAGFDAAVRVLRSMPAALFSSIDDLQASTLDDVSFSVRGGSQTVRWGSAADSALKAEVLAALMQRHTDPGLSFDVSSPTMPVVG